MSHDSGTSTAAQTVLSRTGRYLKWLLVLLVVAPVSMVAVTWPAWLGTYLIAGVEELALMTFAAIGLLSFLVVEAATELGTGDSAASSLLRDGEESEPDPGMYAITTSYYSLLLIVSALLGSVIGTLAGGTLGLIALMLYPVLDIKTGNRFNISPVSFFVIAALLLGELVGIWHQRLDGSGESRAVVNSLPRLMEQLFGRAGRLG